MIGRKNTTLPVGWAGQLEVWLDQLDGQGVRGPNAAEIIATAKRDCLLPALLGLISIEGSNGPKELRTRIKAERAERVKRSGKAA
jgi:hypothetical protein